MNLRRMISFVIMLPVWPFAVLAALADDEAEVSEIVAGFRGAWKRIYESEEG